MSKPIKKFARVSFSRLKFLDKDFASALQKRMKEAESCAHDKSPLPAIVLYGSVLEGVLFKYAEYHLQKFYKTKPKKFSKWNFAKLIEASHEIGVLKPDTMEYVEILRKFRNYIHIQKKTAHEVNFSEDTVIICSITVVAAIKDMKKFKG